MKAAKKPVSSKEEACRLPKPTGSKFERMLLPAPWIEETPPPQRTVLQTIKSLFEGLDRLLNPESRDPFDEGDDEQPKRVWVRVAPGTVIEDSGGCAYHVGQHGELRLGLPDAGHLPALRNAAGKPLRGRARRHVLRKAKLLVQKFQRRERCGEGPAQAAAPVPQNPLAVDLLLEGAASL